MRTPGAIVVGGFINGLGLVRALAAHGARTAVVETDRHDVAARSCRVSQHHAIHDLGTAPERLVEWLEDARPEWAGSLVLPANDEALEALSLARAHLDASYRIAAPPPEMAAVFLDKRRMLEVARAVGVPLPRDHGPATEETAARGDLCFPVLVKPYVGHRFRARFGRKLFVAKDRAALREAVVVLAGAGLGGHVVELIPGGDDQLHAYCVYLDARGEPRGGLTVRKLRQSPPGFGIARVAEIVETDPAIRDATIEILRHIGHRGIASAEFKVDPRDGVPRFLEINGRSVVYNGLLRRAGLDLAAMAWTEHVSGAPCAPRPNGWPGVWINLLADLWHSARSHHPYRFGLGDFLEPYRRPKIEALWASDDPVPFLVEWARSVRRGIRARSGGGGAPFG